MTVIGDAGTACGDILHSVLRRFNIKAKSGRERWDRFCRSRDRSCAEHSVAQAEALDHCLTVLASGYQTGCFDALRPLLAEDCVWESQWRFGVVNGRDAVMEYYTQKGEAM